MKIMFFPFLLLILFGCQSNETVEPPKDENSNVTKVVLTRGNTYASETANMTIDGNYHTQYTSSQTASGDSVILDYTLKTGMQRVDYIKLIQRADGDANLTFSQGSIWYKSASSSEWIFAKAFNVTQGTHVEINVELSEPTAIRVCIRSHRGGGVALTEFECFEIPNVGDLTQDATYFSDDVFSVLKPETTAADLQKITNPNIRSVAGQLLKGTYAREFRSRSYRACENPDTIAQKLKIASRSEYDNPMGIYFKKNEKYIVFVGEKDDSPMELYIKDFRSGGGDASYKLKPGLNEIEASVDGNGYIRYWRDDYATAPAVNVHVLFGNEIGFWDKRAGHTNSDWERILALAVENTSAQSITNAMIDVLGYRIQLVNTVDAFKQYCPADVDNLIMWHDSIMSIEYRMMGFYKYNAVPYNRTLVARSWGGLPNWDGSAAWFPNTEQEMLDATSLRNASWVFGHELGHGNQIRPNMLMTGWGKQPTIIIANMCNIWWVINRICVLIMRKSVGNRAILKVSSADVSMLI